MRGGEFSSGALPPFALGDFSDKIFHYYASQIQKDGSNIISQWDGPISGNHLIAAVGGEPLYVASVPDFGVPGALFSEVGAPDDGLIATAPRAQNKPLHDGTGGSLVIAFRTGPRTDSTLQVILGNNTTATTQYGFAVYYNGSTQMLGLQIVRGVSGTTAFIDSAIPCSRNAKHYMVVSHGTAQTNNVKIWLDGSQVVNANYAAAPGTSDPSAPLTAGRIPNGTTLGFGGHIVEMLGRSVIKSAGDITNIDEYAARVWGF